MLKKGLKLVVLLLLTSNAIMAQVDPLKAKAQKNFNGAVIAAEQYLKDKQYEFAENTFNGAIKIAKRFNFSYEKAINGLKRIEEVKKLSTLREKKNGEGSKAVMVEGSVSASGNSTANVRKATLAISSDNIDDVESETVIKERYEEYLTKVKYPFKTNKSISDDLAFNFIDLAYRHGWNLINHKDYDKAGAIFDYVLSNKDKVDTTSAKVLYALSGLYNGLSNMKSSSAGDDKVKYKYSVAAVLYSRKAVVADGKNDRYKLRLANQIRNLTLADTLYLSKVRKKQLELEYCDIAESIAAKSVKSSGLAYEIYSNCLIDASYDLVSQKKYATATSTLQLFLKRVNDYQKKYPGINYLTLKKTEVLLRIADIEFFNIKNKSLHQTYLNQAFATFALYINSRKSTEVPIDLWWVRSLGNKILNSYELSEDKSKAYQGYLAFEKLMKPMEMANIDVADVAQLAIITKLKIANVQLQMPKADSLKIAGTLHEVITLFKNSDIMWLYNKDMSDDIDSYGRMFWQDMKIAASRNDFQRVESDYLTMKKIMSGVYEKFPYNYYGNRHFIAVSEIYGTMLYKRGVYERAITPLQFASYEGQRKATDMLAEIYNKHLIDTAKAGIYTRLGNVQRDGMYRFTVPIKGDTSQKFFVYLTDRAKGHPYKGIRDQALWLKEARGLELTEDVITSFDKLQTIAWENNISFQKLSFYALGEAKKDTSETIKSAPVDTLSTYFNKYGFNTSLLLRGKTANVMINYLKKYLKAKDFKRADSTIIAILLKDNSAQCRDLLSLISYVYDNGTKTHELYLYDKSMFAKYADYFQRLKVAETNIENWVIIFNKMSVDSAIYASKPNDTLRLVLASDYNSLAWYSLLTQKLSSAQKALLRSLELDPKSVYPYSNGPHLLLFTGNYKKAEEMYLEYKNKPFSNNYPTFKDAFLSDFKDFEKAGIMNDDIKKIKTLLEQP